MIGLGDLPGGEFGSNAVAVSADGNIILGSGHSAAGSEMFIWSVDTGIVNLQDLLISLGVSNVAGWRLDGNHGGISADGLTVTGWGTNPAGNLEAFVATIPEPATSLLIAFIFTGIAVRRTQLRWER
jgi:uncharacterized membrane protein